MTDLGLFKLTKLLIFPVKKEIKKLKTSFFEKKTKK